MKKSIFGLILGAFALLFVVRTDVGAANAENGFKSLEKVVQPIQSPSFQTQFATFPGSEVVLLKREAPEPWQTVTNTAPIFYLPTGKFHNSISTKARSCYWGNEKSNFSSFEPPGNSWRFYKQGANNSQRKPPQ